MSQFWSEVTHALIPYVPGEQPKVADLLKLNTNEHPLEPSPSALQAMAAVSPDQLRRYPDPVSGSLTEAIAEAEGLRPTQVFVGNGSDEVLAHAFQALITSASGIAIPDITYSFYPVWAALYGLAVETVPLRQDLSVDIPGLCAASGAVLLANPNAPTGQAVTLEDLRTLLQSRADRLVVVDEAYFGFGSATAVPLLMEHPNLLITRSLSKSHALAGLRVGYALGSEELIEGLTRVKDSFNSYPLDAYAQAGATAAIRDRVWFTQASQSVAENREWLSRELVSLDFTVCPSTANFLFVRHQTMTGKSLFDGLRARSVLVRRWDKPRIDDYLRITVGTRSGCERLVATLKECLGEQPT